MWFVMTLLAIGTAGYALINVAVPSMRQSFVVNIFETSPTMAYLHLGFGFIAMFCGPFQLNQYLRTRFIRVHRQLGKLYIASVFISAISGFFLALESYGGLVTHVGFAMMAVVWFVSTAMAYYSIMKGSIAEHRKWMIRSYALTLAGVTLRIYLGLGVASGLQFSEFYPVLSWICWVPNILIVEWLFLYKYRST